MFCLGVKVLFWRQMYGFKHRWIWSTSSIILPILLTLPFRFSPGATSKQNNSVLGYLYSGSSDEDSGMFRSAQPLTVIVVPENLDTSSLMTKARSVLLSQYSNSSRLELHLRFASPENLNWSLADSVWPSVGVEFHNVTKQQLMYTLHPVIASNTPENMTGIDDDISPYSLLLQAAIDAAHMQTHFPDRSFPKLQYFDEEMTNGSVSIKDSLELANLAHSCVSTGMLLLVMFLASYIARDKSNGVRELLCVNGLPRWMVNTSWLTSFSLVAAIIALVEMIMIQAPVAKFPGISAPALLVYLIVYHWTVTFFVYLVAKICNHQTLSMSLIVMYLGVLGYLGWMVHHLRKYFVVQALISLLPKVGSIMFIVAAVESNFESKTVISFKTMFASSEKYVSPGLVLIMMMISIILFLGLGLYFDAVKPGPYGRAKPWYLFTGKEKPTADPWFEAETPSEARVYQPIKNGVPIGLECVNIVKKFGTHKALNNVNIRIIKNSITVLMGHNGAGKTTLFSILCGMFSPTSGDVFTNEYNVFEENNIDEFRRVLGYCPQENILMEELTVHEHLIVFGLLKGLVKSKAIEYSDKWTQMFDMSTMRSTQARKLSGGSKRKLCLAIAMTGNPQYLLLDEPSAGLDIASTRKFCDILLEEKGNCTVVVTTHNMDEAELLGERIAIIAHGELKCYGSPKFLKKMLDTGYRLNCYITSGMSTQDAIMAVSTLIPSGTVLFKTNHSVTFSLRIKNTKIPGLLRRLESQFGGKMSSTLSPSTLDDVFIKVQKDMGVKIAIEDLPIISEETIRRSCWNFTELFKKRAKWMLSVRMVSIIVYTILMPNVIMIICMVNMNSNIKNESSSQIWPNSFSKYRGILAMYDHISDFAQSIPTGKSITFGEKSKNMTFTQGNMPKKYLFKYRSKVLFAIDTQSDTPNFPDKSSHDVSEIYTALMNALIKGNASIVTYNTPFLKERTSNEASNECPMHDYYFIFIQPVIIFMFSFTFLLASSYFVVFPHTERTTVFKHLQLMTGLLPAAYWLANLVFDMLIYTVSCVLLIITTACMDRTTIFLQSYVMWVFILIMFLYGLSGTTYSYIWSFCCRSHSGAMLFMVLFNFLLPLAMDIIFIFIWPWPRIIDCVNIFMPHRILGISMDNLIEWAIKRRDCINCPSSNHEESCFYVNNNPLFEGLKSPLITLAIQAVAWFVVIVLFDHGLGRKLKGGLACGGDISSLGHDVNPEVALERKRVKKLVMNDNKDEQPEFIVDGLGKNYCEKTAVYDVTFAAECGECFGLVGVNGSGKTTTFGMLAALMSPTKGTAFVEGKWKMTGCEYNYIKRIGYCPQHGGLLNDLPGRNTLKLFGKLCGVPRSQINELVDKWINAMDMTEIAKRPCGQYSGGNKRKLSSAIALIGNTPVALLDEPTAGVDPVVRRRIWEILTNRLEHNQTIILTSHTMSECEAICDRLTIMVNGVMKCLGPIPTLKKTYGKRSTLEVKFSSSSTIEEQDAVKSKIESEFHGYITLEDRLLTRLKFSLNTENTKMYDLYATILRIQSDYKVVEDFSLVEAPLEQVFMMFAKN